MGSCLLRASAGLLVLPLQASSMSPPQSTCPAVPPQAQHAQVPDQMRLTKPLSLLGIQATCSLALQLFHKENKQDFRLPSRPSARDPENQTLCCLRITLTTPTLALHPGSHHPLCIWESQSNGSEVTGRPLPAL